MAFQNQNNKQQESVNSRGFQFFNKDGFDPSTMIIRFWNQHLVLTIHPAKEAAKQTDTSVYDYDKSVNLVIPPVIAESIAYSLYNKIIPAVEKGEEYTESILVGNNSALVLSSGVKRFNKVCPHVIILRNIQQGTFEPEDSLRYAFTANGAIEDYDGTGKPEVLKPIKYWAELNFFAHVLSHMTTAILGIENHARRVADKRFNDEVFKLYKAIADKIGHSFYEESGRKYSGNGGNSLWDSMSGNGTEIDFNKPRQNTNSAPAVTPTAVGSLDELEGFM